ncbi:MAG: hypothetical protein HYY17_02800 [Planctomycetes bacterium]|nr:hypothetical protein [Planctomycetota bacterium]
MDSIIRSRHGYREKKISVADRPSSSLWDAVPGKKKNRGDFWKLVAALVLTVFAAVLLLRNDVFHAARALLSNPAPTERAP